ncbi:uncharacterized protein LOC141719654 [Apium graveolens]|uniref:uncharacterized protein LOC141719654 n=1 Tax=Apium graveolens TaxID=4045 RepID=UPI003D7A08FF
MALNLLEYWKRMNEVVSTGRGTYIIQHNRWCKPPDGWIKINIDAACCRDSEYIRVGCVVHNDKGEFLRARSNIIRNRGQPREAEAVSLKEALSWMKTWRTNKYIFESDAKLLVVAFQRRRGKSLFDTIVEDCQEILKHFQEVLIVFINRSANMPSHLLAHAAYSMSGPHEWCYTPSDFIMCNLNLEEI